uniref:Uncharacterized protein n=1 Tax=Arundo donax TaxID=35708 RepID=A0A0A9H5Y1_ARUDO
MVARPTAPSLPSSTAAPSSLLRRLLALPRLPRQLLAGLSSPASPSSTAAGWSSPFPSHTS